MYSAFAGFGAGVAYGVSKSKVIQHLFGTNFFVLLAFFTIYLCKILRFVVLFLLIIITINWFILKYKIEITIVFHTF